MKKLMLLTSFLAVLSLNLFVSFAYGSELKNYKEINSLQGREVVLKKDILVSYGVKYNQDIECSTDSLVFSSNENSQQSGQTWDFSQGTNLKIETVTTNSQSGLFRLEDGNKSRVEVRIKATGISSENEKRTFGLICYSSGQSISSRDAKSKAVRLINDLFEISQY